LPSSYLPILLMLGLAAAVAAGMLAVSWIFGGHRNTERKLSTYESGMPLYDAAHKRISVKFFIVAMIFILFDVEAAFLFPWAVVFRELGTFALVEMFVFLFLLVLGYAYLWRKGGLDWGEPTPKARTAPRVSSDAPAKLPYPVAGLENAPVVRKEV
jgi:NADH-quinone oxidoreductase subunit A